MFLFKTRTTSKLKLFFILVLFILMLGVLIVSKNVNEQSKIDIEKKEQFFRGVILGSSEGAYGFGHVALLMENETAWVYFSWQTVGVVFVSVPPYALTDLESFNKWIDEEDSPQNYIHNYDSAIVFKGDFSESIKKAEELFRESVKAESEDHLGVILNHENPGYNFLFNNCVDAVYEVLVPAKISKGTFGEIVEKPSLIANLAVKQLDASLDTVDFFSK